MSEATRMLLIRHGEVDGAPGGPILLGRTDAPLHRRGFDQASRLGRWVKALRPRPARLYTSPLRRARQTAAPLAEALGLAPTALPALQEIDCGAVDGWPIEEVARLHPALWQANLRQDDDHFRWPGGESYAELRARALGAIAEIWREAPPGAVILAVTHTGVVSELLGWLHGLPAARWACFRPSHASLTELRCPDSGPPILLRFDDRAHLDEARG